MIRTARRLASLVAGTAGLAGLVLAAPAPAGAVDPGWTVTVDRQERPAGGPLVVVTGEASRALGARVTSVRVRLFPTEALPERCGPFPVEASDAPSGDRYRVELVPRCNGPYRAEAVAFGTFLGRPVSSGSPATGPVALADPGGAPAPPSVTREGSTATARWAGAGDPDVVGWTLQHEGGASRDLPAGTTSAEVPVGPGAHRFRLVARRWGAEGPAGPRVASPASAAAGLTVPEVRAQPPAPTDPPGGPDDAADGGGAAPPDRPDVPGRGGAGSTAPPTTRQSPGTTSGASGFRGELPYGAPDGAFVPGEAGADAEPGGESSAAGTSPSARFVRSTERTSPGLVAPFALALVMATVAVHIAAYLRRAARAAEAHGG